ncbi:nucleotide-diphosphate-sugar epimerase [Actinoplanes ianthinogenes]|uniref:Nucleotide-diphosphate-sugar epimerase n=1 Tax=Actinoplanes ianthinogenes TaxID=122358 RepID=A0ABM7LL75_9ACTN|nr:NAD(P)H-binding protein [Actinoplanes ianthinogenes]BCJ39923.1 nucleotide-diphosphate-sugar epimerase [Actinoplanes ianthinogenes]GGR09041.1 nucleotide-diphosphate-sugar epimerase [Actinoplanes ianthinogenes]
MTILVTGATGAVGRHVVTALVAAGERVRATSRKPQDTGLPMGVEVVGPDGDLFDDVDRMFVFPLPHGVDDLVTAAVAAGVQKFVVLSSLAAAGEFARDLGSASYTHHRAIEESVTTRTGEWTIVRPGTFANILLSWAWPIRSGAPIRAPYVNSAQAPIHEADVGEVAAAILTSDGHRGATYPLTGPQSLTRAEQVAAIAAGIGREIRLIEITPDEFRSDMRQLHVPDDIVDMLLDYWSDTVAEPDRVRPGVADLTGHAARTLTDWARDHRADLT